MGKIFENSNAKRQFVTLYEDLDDDTRAVFGQKIRDMFDSKITDVTLIEGFYLNESDVRKCHEMALEEMKNNRKKTVFRNQTVDPEDEDPVGPDEEGGNKIPKNW